MTAAKRFENMGAQGDVIFRRVKSIPKSATKKAVDGPVIVAHSETGHHHAFAKECGVTYYTTKDPMVAFLRVDSSSVLEHHRSFDTHAPVMFDPGCYELRRPREYVSRDEQRMVAD